MIDPKPEIINILDEYAGGNPNVLRAVLHTMLVDLEINQMEDVEDGKVEKIAQVFQAISRTSLMAIVYAFMPNPPDFQAEVTLAFKDPEVFDAPVITN